MQHPKIMLPILLFLSFGTALTKKRIKKYAILKIRQEAMEFFFPSPSTKVVIVMSVDSILKIMPLFRKEWYPIYNQEPNMQYLHTKALPKTHLTCRNIIVLALNFHLYKVLLMRPIYSHIE